MDNNFEEEYLKIKYKDENTCYYYINKSSSIDHIIGYQEFEMLNRYIEMDLFSFLNR